MSISILQTDVNECKDSVYKCEDGECENFPGGWNCFCKDGFEVKETYWFQRQCVGKRVTHI